MKVFLTTLVGVWVYGALPSLAAELPKSPWAAQEQTVKINIRVININIIIEEFLNKEIIQI